MKNPFVTEAEITKFREIVRRDYGLDLTEEQATEQATALLMMFESVIKEKVIVDNGSTNDKSIYKQT